MQVGGSTKNKARERGGGGRKKTNVCRNERKEGMGTTTGRAEGEWEGRDM